MVPVTIVEFELGRRTLAQSNLVSMIDHDHDPATPAVVQVSQQLEDDESAVGKRLHLLGFNNSVSAKEAQNFRDWERILLVSASAFFATLFLIAIIFILFVY